MTHFGVMLAIGRHPTRTNFLNEMLIIRIKCVNLLNPGANTCILFTNIVVPTPQVSLPSDLVILTIATRVVSGCQKSSILFCTLNF